MFSSRFYNQTTRRYVSVMGTLFNDIVIYRENSGGERTRIKVPISYGPHQKFLSRITQDPDLASHAITLPRISFQITGINYDGNRKLTSSFRNGIIAPDGSPNAGTYNTALTPVPYNIDFDVSVMVKYSEDGTKIIEQILPYFRPEFTPSIKLLDDLDLYMDVPFILNSVTTEDTYEGDYKDRRALIWNLSITVKGWFFGPTTNKKVIKFATVNNYSSDDGLKDTITAQPGLTANGQPTTQLSETIPYQDINSDDDWDYIVTIINDHE